MVRLDKIYTRGGDQGQTSLGDGQRVAKSDLRIVTCGDVDEANAALGIARYNQALDQDLDQAKRTASSAMLARIQNDLFDLGADLCVPTTAKKQALRIMQDHIDRLEAEIDHMNSDLPPLTSFILPGGTAAGAGLHLARSIIRRAERSLSTLAARDPINPCALGYLNRLSDHIFVLGRYVNDGRDVLWQPGANITKS